MLQLLITLLLSTWPFSASRTLDVHHSRAHHARHLAQLQAQRTHRLQRQRNHPRHPSLVR